MSIAVLQGAAGSRDQSAAPMRWPVAIGGCFAWFHAPGDLATGRVGVVLCAGLKQDAMTGHRPFRLLADALAAAGHPTLRFDYPGVGDSCDPDPASPAATEFWQEWQQSVHAAIDWLRRESGAERVVLCGLRLGATLAATVARERADVAGLLLLAPVLRGRSYMRQLAIEAAMHDPAADAAGGIVLNELRLSRETVERIGRIDLRAVTPAAGTRILVHATASSPVLTATLEAWRRHGAVVSCADFVGMEPFLRPAFMNHDAPADIGRLVGWLADAFPAEAAAGRAAAGRAAAGRAAAGRAIRVPGRPVLHPAGCVETPWHFGPGNRLFGVLCAPADGRGTERIAVVIGNSGGEPHTGFARVSVNLARHLAAHGFASLRMDFAGLGDSMAEGDVGTHVFETDRQADFAAAIDALQAAGYRRFAIHGLCSGAYHALHAALADRRVSRLTLVNLPFFQWQAGMPIEDLVHVSHVVVDPGHLLRRLGGLDFWRQALRGRRDIRLRVAAQTRWFAGRAKALAWRAGGLLGIAAPADFARDSMAALATRTRTLMVFSEWDAGRARLAQIFGPRTAPPGATVRVLRGLDHALTGAAMQRIAADEIVGFLEREETAPG